MAALAFEIEHRVDHMLEHARARNGAFLGDMADEQQDRAALLGRPDQLLGRRPDLGNRAWRGLQRIDIHGLDRIDDDKVRPVGGVHAGRDVPDAGCGCQLDRSVGNAHSGRAHPNLVDRFFAGDVDGAAFRRRTGRNRQ